MNSVKRLFGLLAMLLGVSAVCGCSDDGDEPHTNPKTYSKENVVEHIPDMDRMLDGYVRSVQTDDGDRYATGRAIAARIRDLKDEATRMYYLEEFRKTVLGIALSGDDYVELSHKIAASTEMHRQYLATAHYCGKDLEHGMLFRIDFLKWLKMEMERPLNSSDSQQSGNSTMPFVSNLYVSKEMYQQYVKEKYELHLRWLEEYFNEQCVLNMSPSQLDLLRQKIEMFLGRRIRTMGKINQDRFPLRAKQAARESDPSGGVKAECREDRSQTECLNLR